ncbi:Phosphoribosylformylglycinamidine synthase [Eumeta japonica]|uniref:Phosphoribosylformylglycinamidine synthase n=1 Tax=Eumeta variegata TaxID=151549 RepID=A0A4C1SSY0_EUMVA|nr:Phosphoribosylformylglycinamidine synthase [Eumeta japonica]
MTECLYTNQNLPRLSFNEGLPRDLEPWFIVPLQKEGKIALEKVNEKLGLAFDAWDIEFYLDLFVNKLKRDPTSVELFDLAQSNSEHSRHWFFKGKIILDGKVLDKSLIEMVAETQTTSNDNNVIKFGDNTDVHRLLVEAYNEAALSERTCREWFQNGDFDVGDKDRSGRLKIYEDAELEEDSSQTQEELALTLELTRQAVSHRLKSLGIIHMQDIAPSDYHLFQSIAPALLEQRFTSYEDTKNWVDSWIVSKDKEFFKLGI